jgi:hypothetical protein
MQECSGWGFLVKDSAEREMENGERRVVNHVRRSRFLSASLARRKESENSRECRTSVWAYSLCRQRGHARAKIDDKEVRRIS